MIAWWASRREQLSTWVTGNLSMPVAGVLTRIRTGLQPVCSQAAARWHGLTSKERRQVLWMVAVVVGAVIWLLFTKPALDTLRHWESELPRLKSQSAALHDVLAEVGGMQVVPSTNEQSAPERVKNSLDQAGMAGMYRVAEEEGDLVVIFEQPVDASRLVSWLITVPAVSGSTVQQASLERVSTHDAEAQDIRVRASVRLAQQSRNGT